MTKSEAMRLSRQSDTLQSLGFSREECETLRRASMTLRRWFERECNGEIERDEKTGKPVAYNPYSRYVQANDHRAYRVVADREAGARKRIAAILTARNARHGLQLVSAYIQCDPRGAALYILRAGDVPAGADVDAYYSRGVCVC
jgi:hypothetical protein